MKNSIGTTILVLACIVALIFGITIARFMRSPQYSTEQLAEMGLVLYETPRNLSPFELTDDRGQPFGPEQLRGHWNLVFFGYTFCPDICPTTLALLTRVERQLEQDQVTPLPQVIFVSVDPQRDTAEQLLRYLGNFNPDFIGASNDDIPALADFAKQLNSLFAKVPLSEDDPSQYLVDHSGHILLINPQGQLAGFFRTPHQLDNLVQTYKAVIDR